MHSLLHSQFNLPPDLQHAKGHQDDGTPVNFLDAPSKMNVAADTLATYDLYEYGSTKSIIRPMSGIQLVMMTMTMLLNNKV
jgi:hypothetical protein